MLLFCPTCANVLVIEEGPKCYRFACNTCPYVHDVTQKVIFLLSLIFTFSESCCSSQMFTFTRIFEYSKVDNTMNIVTVRLLWFQASAFKLDLHELHYHTHYHRPYVRPLWEIVFFVYKGRKSITEKNIAFSNILF